MKPSPCTASDHIENVRMFATFFQYEDPKSETFLQNALLAIEGAKYLARTLTNFVPH